jgi:hypothetical protein
VVDACLDFTSKKQLNSLRPAEYAFVQNCSDAIYDTLFNNMQSDCSGDNDCDNDSDNEDTYEIDDHMVIHIAIVPPHHFPVSHLTPFSLPVAKDVYIKVIPPPPLFFI